jgi:hypothetical protein
MKDLKYSIAYNITIAENLNMGKENGIKKLEDRFDKVPEQWKQRTRKFIEVIKGNIKQRYDYISELERLVILIGDVKSEADIEKSFTEIIGQLQVLDNKDIIACDMYDGTLSEGV